MKKKTKAGGTTIPDFSLYYKAVLIKQHGIGTKTDTETNGIEERLQNWTHKSGKNIQWKKDSLFNKWCWENWTATCRSMKLDHSYTIHENKLKMDEGYECETGNNQNPRGKNL